MSITGNGTSSSSSSTSTSTPSSYSYIESYSTVYHSSSTYKVVISTSFSGSAVNATVWVKNDGTVVAVNFAGFNQTGAAAQQIAPGLFAAFTLQIQADSLISFYTGTNYFHSTGTSTVNIGPTQVTVTNYAANSLPLTYTGCGSSTTLTAYSFSVGTPKGASSPLVTNEHIAGSDFNSDGSTDNFDYTLHVTSITLA